MAARPIGEFVREVSRQLRGPASLAPEALAQVWARVAGPRLAAATRVLGFRAGTLTVSTRSAALRGEIEAYQKPELIRRLQEGLPMPVTQIQVRLRD